MFTKKDLAQQFKISLNTVRKTLESCGLDTAKPDYTDDEIANRFEVARKLLTEEQKSYVEVAAHFGVTINDMNDDSPTSERDQRVKYESHIADPLHTAITENVYAYVQEVTDEAVEGIVAYLPQMMLEAAQKVVRSGVIDDVFQKMLAQRRAFSRDFPNNGTTITIGGLRYVDDDDKEEDFEITA